MSLLKKIPTLTKEGADIARLVKETGADYVIKISNFDPNLETLNKIILIND